MKAGDGKTGISKIVIAEPSYAPSDLNKTERFRVRLSHDVCRFVYSTLSEPIDLLAGAMPAKSRGRVGPLPLRRPITSDKHTCPRLGVGMAPGGA